MLNTMIKVDELNCPPTIGEYYLVPCVINKTDIYQTDDEELYWREEKLHINYYPESYITPVINNYHNDVKTGQKEFHYHVDHRFEVPLYCGRYIQKGTISRPTDKQLEYLPLKCISLENRGITRVNIFKTIKFSKCMKNNKCVHKQFNMNTVVEDENGIKTCPLHGLQYRKNKLITNAN